MNKPIRSPLPSVDEVLRHETAQAAAARFGRTAVTAQVRRQLEGARAAFARGERGEVQAETVALAALQALEEADQPSQRRVFNLTGTVLHTNLGRAVLPEAAVQAVAEAMRSPTTLEFNLRTGQRGERDDHVRGVVRELTGAEDAVLVNNNAAAALLVLAALAKGKETIVSRGELIEIGGSFRMPAIMASAGTKLVEVGTTNRTHLKDYAEAIGPRTGLLMRVHTSNYIVQGFTKAVPEKELADLARERGVPFVDDLGSGTLVDLARWGLRRERTVQDALRDGADLVTFSGDKLLGGPQAGFIAGRKDLVQRCARHPMKRAVRLDKLRLAALEATLKLYRDPDRLPELLPTLRFFTRSRDELRAVAARLAPGLQRALDRFAPAGWRVETVDYASQIGSGALPLDTLRSAGLACVPLAKRPGKSLDRLAVALRSLPIPVIGRISEDRLVLDLRCLEDEAGFLATVSALDETA
ncbi:L-seryl-tRNA(Sec) selenium transferase [Alsobacter soli]|uniref:L-seryl-tRNA(Sec) selenium transferase n=1 Tax=Alsobacter soli TaxID=2109933 RepID=A0A2T1HQU3_9HYPH|nr:L-seryl-tRNA(Sec) selenium transferase [Alsobacter soli]PSC04025.1 L-seryl-tRNA(Sec) selenium transferase [Alsobacter soli]